MKGQSGCGTHDVGLIPAMYNSPTAGAEHVHLYGQDRRQASLKHWHIMLVMCHSTRPVGDGWLVRMCMCTGMFDQVEMYLKSIL